MKKNENNIRPTFGYTCSYVPVEVIYAAGYLPKRIIGRTDLCLHTDSMLSGNLCPYVHSILDIWRKSDDRCAGIALTDSCDAMKSLFHVLSLESGDRGCRPFFLSPPRIADENSVAYFTGQLREFYRTITGQVRDEKTEEAKVREAIEQYDTLRDSFHRFYRSVKHPRESYFVALKERLYEMDPAAALEELENVKREGEGENHTQQSGIPIAVLGSPIPGNLHLALIEKSGFTIALYDSCLYNRWDPAGPIVDRRDDPFEELAVRYLTKISCPRMADRHEFVDTIIDKYREKEIKGIIHFRMPFCDLHGFDYSRLLGGVDREGLIQIESDGSAQIEGQVSTRVQAFYEVLSEKLQKQRERRIMNKKNGSLFCGIDIGSATVDGILIDSDGNLIASGIKKTGPGAEKTAYILFQDMLEKAQCGKDDAAYIMATGYGREAITFANGTVTEITCHAKGAVHVRPNVRFVIDIGGQDSKVIRIDEEGKVSSFQMNDKCAAGTGRFLDVMAGALGMDLAEVNRYGLQDGEIAAISSVCTVFAESEVVSLIAKGVPAADIARGVFTAITRRISGMVRRVGLIEPVIMTGGGALNPGLVRSMEKHLGVTIEVPEVPQLVGARGAALIGKDKVQDS